MNSAKINVKILRCPKCDSKNIKQLDPAQLICSSCKTSYPIQDGILCMLPNPESTTYLNETEYDRQHNINDGRSRMLYQQWLKQVFTPLGIEGGALLELGAGSGQLTGELINSRRFKKVYVTDISPIFLQQIKTRRNVLQDIAEYYACDANHMPFQENVFDIVIGNSVLHHFLDYPDTLRQCARCLKPGGYAVFYEPFLQGKVMVSLIIGLIIHIAESEKINYFTEKELESMKTVLNHQMAIPAMKHKKNILKNIEDKYIFDWHDLNALYRSVGFSDFQVINATDESPVDYERSVKNTLAIHGIEKSKLDCFDFVFEGVKKTYCEALQKNAYTPMTYLVFKK